MNLNNNINNNNYQVNGTAHGPHISNKKLQKWGSSDSNTTAISNVSTAAGSDLSQTPKVEKKSSLLKLKKAIIITLTQASFDFTEDSDNYSMEDYFGYYNHLKSKFKRLFVQEFHTKHILLYSMELFRKVLDNAEQTGTTFNMANDSLFKIYIVCFFIANKFVDEMHYISADDLSYIAHTSEKVIKSLEIALLNDVLGWKLLDLKNRDSKGRYIFMKWDYRQVVRSFHKAFPAN
jgi:hypothetical protein